jgi:hypothetical protein
MGLYLYPTLSFSMSFRPILLFMAIFYVFFYG